MNIGFDKNINSQQSTFFSADGNNWSKSRLPGSLMLRPIFSTELNKTVSLPTEADEINRILLFPNPTADIVTISLNNVDFYGAVLLDVNGVVVNKIDLNERKIDMTNLSSGVYFFKLINNNQVHKLIKQ